ncbi:MAG: DUF4159 domain-containing protein [Phycisphaerales bacterium]|nr:DUF4159 domain-containing protein [Phycisphaerales bacterium]
MPLARASTLLLHALFALVLSTAPSTRADAHAQGADASPAASAPWTKRDTDLAIEALTTALLAGKDPLTFWEPSTLRPGDSPQEAGYTALVVVALLHAGLSPQDNRLSDAVAFLRTAEPRGTYAVAARALVWARLSDASRPLLEKDVQWLLQGLGRRTGGWDYRQQPDSARRDNSISQFAALALWEAARRGVKVPDDAWRRIETGFLGAQSQDGGWNYDGSGAPRGSMTAAGLATLLIAQDTIHAREFVRLGARLPEAAQRNAQAIRRGMEWMDRWFSPHENPGFDTHFLYYLWAVERLGLTSGRRAFARIDWLPAGAAELERRLLRRVADASGTTGFVAYDRMEGRADGEPVRTDDLAFALLFLARARTEIAFAKLDDGSAHWNHRPRDIATVADWLGEQLERELGWQVVSIDGDPDGWIDAPILVVCSDRPPAWVPPRGAPDASAIAKLQRYVGLGGTVVAIAEGSNRAFQAAIERAARAIAPDASWRLLPNDHPLFTALYRFDGARPRIWGLSNGVRELLLLIDDDWCGTFQSRDHRSDLPWRLTANLWALATESGQARVPLPTAPRRPVHADRPNQRTVHVVRTRHDGAWNAEPLAMDALRQAAIASGLDVRVETVDLDQLANLDPPPTLAIVGGVDAVALSPAQVASIRAYVEAGGMVLFETTGGHGAFAEAAEIQLSLALGRTGQALLSHPAASGSGVDGATPLGPVRLRGRPPADDPALTRLRTIEFDGRPALLFSPEDLDHALLGHPSAMVRGYRTETARRLLANLLWWASTPRPPAAPGPPPPP